MNEKCSMQSWNMIKFDLLVFANLCTQKFCCLFLLGNNYLIMYRRFTMIIVTEWKLQSFVNAV